jgi:hypothetical protein
LITLNVQGNGFSCETIFSKLEIIFYLPGGGEVLGGEAAEI